MSGVGRRISKPGSPITVTWNDAGLKAIFDELHPDQMHKMSVNAFRAAGNRLKKMVIEDAKSAGLGGQSAKEDEGWEWQTYGRIPKSIKVGKVWSRGFISSMRVFSARAKSRGFMNSAPHTNIVVSGYTQKIPVPGSNARAVPSGETKSGKPVFARANRAANSEFVKALEAGISRIVKRINKKYAT